MRMLNRGVHIGMWVLCACAAAAAQAQGAPAGGQGQKAPPAASLDALLQQVEQGYAKDRAEQARRVSSFERVKERQQALLQDAKAAEQEALARSDALEQTFEDNETRLKEQEQLLVERMGTLGELFGVVRQVAGDTAAHVEGSVVSAQLPGRAAFLAQLGQSKALPEIGELQRLWFSLMQEMTEQGKVVRFPATVVVGDGEERQLEAVRVGAFNVVADGKYLSFVPETGKLIELPRQPASRYVGLVDDLEEAQEGFTRFAVDPSRGSLLSLLVQTPDLEERLEAGGVVGYIILVLGAIAAVFALLRLGYLLAVASRVRRQQAQPMSARQDNPLGRVLAVWSAQRKAADVETLERKLDEAVLRESSSLERYLWAVKVVAVVAPLLGLLGTVTGMIRTFQAITLFGTGDPKLMAGGISEALVTTMLGLIVAVPMVLLHSVLRSTVRRMTDTLQEQAAGLIAVQAEAVPSAAAE